MEYRKIENQVFQSERALYHSNGVTLNNCRFEGEEDGESALKESEHVEVTNSYFALRYPFWHTKDFRVTDCTLTQTARAAFWYCDDGRIENTAMNGIKALRECNHIRICNCTVNSVEYGWNSKSIVLEDCDVTSEYLFFGAGNLEITKLKLNGKYSFQYTKNATIKNSELNTKDAFWHGENITVEDSVIRGEYLGWYSNGLKLVRCKIIGTQPLCYCRNLELIDCEMIEADLAFEYSDLQADLRGTVVSVKNPLSGKITADGIGEIITSDAVYPCCCEIAVRNADGN